MTRVKILAARKERCTNLWKELIANIYIVNEGNEQMEIEMPVGTIQIK